MRIYIIGPVSGFDDLNLPAFEKACDELCAAGYAPLMPHDFVAADADWQKAMRRSIETLAKADGVACLDGWQQSRGARIEGRLAKALGIEVASVDTWCKAGEHIEEMCEKQKERKQCGYCKRILPVSLFNSSAKNADGMQAYCRDCMAEYKQNRQSA